jgi:hypothetical protein
VHVTIYNHFTFSQLATRSKRDAHWVATSSTG